MSIEEDIQVNKQHLMKGFPILHTEESADLTYQLLINDFGEPFKRCSMYSRYDLATIYKVVEFNQGVQFSDIADNAYLLSELLYLGVRYLAFFDGSREFVNAIGCSEYGILKELVQREKYKITDVPVKIHDLNDLDNLLYLKLTKKMDV